MIDWLVLRWRLLLLLHAWFWGLADVHAIEPEAESCQGMREREDSCLHQSELPCDSRNGLILPFPLAVSLSFWEVKGWRHWLVLWVRSQGHRGFDRGGERSVVGGLRVGVAFCKRLLLRLGGGGRGMGALTRTAAGLCAGTCLFHLPPLC